MNDLLVPEATGTPLENNPFLYRIYSMLRAGQQPSAISDALYRAEGVRVPIDDITAYLRALPESELAVTALQKRFGDITGDPVQDMYRLLALEQERIAELMEGERQEKKRDPGVDAALKTHFNHLEKFTLLLQKLGVNYWGNPAVRAQQDEAPTIAVILGLKPKNVPGETVDGEARLLP